VGVSDEALLAGMASGDEEAMTAFVRRHQARVYGLALAVVGGAAVAEEVAQEAFVRAWKYAGNYDPRRAKASTWLLVITRNAAVDVIRARRETPTEPLMLAETIIAPGRDDDRVVDSDRITTALRSLPPEQAEAVVLSVHFGLTAVQISERQGVPLGTAKTRLRTGLSRLRTLLEVSRD
jgi:RNA polymerase sigma-70 factor (ECF subfamily)